MVTVNVSKKYLLQLAGKKLSDLQLEEALHQIKSPIDSQDGNNLVIEVNGDRPDLLSAEGISRALKGYLGVEKGIPSEKFGKSGMVVNVDSSVKSVREFIVCAVVENLKISDDDLADLIQIQEKLTLTHGRKRKKVAIGLHDTSMLTAPYFYKAVDPKSISFIPLGKDRKMDLQEIIEKHEKGIDYAYILDGAKKYPVIFDSKNQVLSFPPIINGALTMLTTNTKSIFIDITGLDYHACNIALNILCQDFADRGASVKTVEIKSGGKAITTPETAPEKMELDIGFANKLLGTELSAKQIVECLKKQRISAKIKNPKTIECLIPKYRADFLHPVDLVEEVALGYGFNKFIPKQPSVYTKGELSENTKLIDDAVGLMIGFGFMQINTPILTNEKLAGKVKSISPLVKILNPISEEYENVRSSLLPQMLDTLSKNTHNIYPQKIFEIGSTIIANPKIAVQCENNISIAAAIASPTANISDLSPVLLELLGKLQLEFDLHKSELKMFISGRQATLKGKGAIFGEIGEISPEILEMLKMEVPISAFEIVIKRN
ncbi:phenylalanine--tRNA ligase subunit beta [Candidatus Micrarchaeota archaeon]|nr:phenylalanine--tRNA ligase subunit beta [Candidatus Micrarchaeota archaeon]